MTTIDRPMIFDGQENRQMNDAEYAQYQADQQAAETAAAAATARAWVELRMKRDRWLAQTDAFFITPLPSDFPAAKASDIEANQQAWLDFRQALRDLPANTTDPANPTWPSPPSAPLVFLT